MSTKKNTGLLNLMKCSCCLKVGSLLEKGLIYIDLVPFRAGRVKITWEKIKPMIEVGRKRFNEPKFGYGSEYLANEMKKRE